jgi:hypothetical protein
MISGQDLNLSTFRKANTFANSTTLTSFEKLILKKTVESKT